MNLQEAEQAQMACKIKYKKGKANANELRKEFEKRVNAKRAVKYKTLVETQEKITKNAFE
jgi:phage tail tape-measure protein